jgi:ketosteroid isomerase-like protein
MNGLTQPNWGMPRSFVVILGFLLCLTLCGTASAQKKKKNDTTPPPAAPTTQLPDEQKIDYLIGEMLGAWQVGDIEKLHAAYADDVSVVSGNWGPPVIGWQSYLAGYQMQRARTQQVRMDRLNTLVRVGPGGNVAWACYQWEFSGVVDGQASGAKGQTTLVLEKKADGNWVIIHNHTSIAQSSTGQPVAPQAQPTPQPKP